MLYHPVARNGHAFYDVALSASALMRTHNLDQ